MFDENPVKPAVLVTEKYDTNTAIVDQNLILN